MKEFIEKLIARLEEYKRASEDDYIGLGCEDDFGAMNAYGHSIEIVKELAEEHKDKIMIDGQYCWQTCGATEHCKECNRLCNGSIDYYENYDFMAEEHNGGWIPFDDPTCDSGNIPDDEVLVCKEDGTIDFDIYDFMQDDWKYNSKHHKNKVIAWQPLPEPYKAEEPQWKKAMMNTFLKR